MSTESHSEMVARVGACETGQIVSPEMQRSSVIAYMKLPGEGSRYKVLFEGGHWEKCSLSTLKCWLREDLAEEAVKRYSSTASE